MILISSSLERPVFTSAWMPRSLKMATAAGDNLSEIRTLGMNFLQFPPTPNPSPRWGRGSEPFHLTRVGRSERVSAPGGPLLFHLREGPIEPRCQSFDIGCFHRGAAPDA